MQPAFRRRGIAEFNRQQAELKQEPSSPVKPGECQFCGLYVGRGIGFHRLRCKENPNVGSQAK